jgi:hypothetical protein
MANKPIVPITPHGVLRKKGGAIPSIVYEVFNELITSNFDGKSATVYQDDVVFELARRGETRGEIFNKRWLDIEEEYRAVGWSVEYEKPAYNESGRAFFTFSMWK